MQQLKFSGIRPMAVILAFFLAPNFIFSSPSSASDNHNRTIETIIAGVEKRYNTPGFTAAFDQESIIKAMAVTDTASGKLMVRQPGKMRWEYLVPEPQTIITDGNDLWVFRPEDNQVMVGKAPTLFGEGKGAGFLSNIRMVRERFQISLEETDHNAFYRLKLVPNQSSADLMEIHLDIEKNQFDVVQITTFNVYGDETRIQLKNVDFDDLPPDHLFRFDIPEGADVVQMNQQ